MKYIITLFCTLAIIIVACKTSNRSESLFPRPDDVKADQYTINVDRDTTLTTKNGALIKIPKGSLSVDKGNTVTLDIKEAYTIQQMIAAGLYTESDGDPLSSGGMIYINAAAGQNVTINQPLKVALPTANLQKGMQLYKGVKDEKGNINWKDPSPIADNPRLTVFEQGQQLFQSKCASCHALGKDGVAPDLAHFVNRFASSSWGYGESGNVMQHGLPTYSGWTAVNALTNYEAVEYAVSDSLRRADTSLSSFFSYTYYYDHTYAYKCNLINKYKKAGPSMEPKKLAKKGIFLTSDELDKILRFIQYESNRLSLPLPVHAYLNDCIDSCGRYMETVDRLNKEKADLKLKKDTLRNDNEQMVKESRTPVITNTGPAMPVNSPAIFEEVVSPESYGAVYYQFTIESFGWYNVDMLLKEFNGSQESELFVRITGEFKEKVQVYLIIPSARVYTQGGLKENSSDEFVFAYKSGKLYLPQNTTGYIMAVTETSESIAYALKEFTTTTTQRFDISLQGATKEEFNAAISILNSGDMKISVADSKNAAEIRKTEAELKAVDEKLKTAEGLKPKNCDCLCGSTAFPATSDSAVTNFEGAQGPDQ